jgi:hypothetical protein
VLEEFSLADGRPVRRLATLKVEQGTDLAMPTVDRSGEAWLTFSSGPRCTSNVSGCGPAPNSCSGRVLRLNLSSGQGATPLRFPPSQLVGDVVPSPNGERVVEVGGGCASSFFNAHLIVRDLRFGREWTIGADAARCHDLGTPSWNAGGTQLVFPYGPSVLSKRAVQPAAGTCEAPKFDRLVIVSAEHQSKSTSWNLIRAGHGCSYQAATFDRWGVAAVEGCVQGEPAGQYSVSIGDAYLVQLSHRDQVIRRLPLQPGWETGSVSTESDGMVLVSQDQPANEGYPERDWVWQFDGRKLRLVAHYKALDAAEVIAVAG